MEEFLQQIANAINNHAVPRSYDYWLLAFTALSVILSFYAIFATIKIAKRQTAISEKQTEIMVQQREIATLDKKYKCLYILEMIYKTHSLLMDKSWGDLSRNDKIYKIAESLNDSSDFNVEIYNNDEIDWNIIGIKNLNYIRRLLIDLKIGTTVFGIEKSILIAKTVADATINISYEDTNDIIKIKENNDNLEDLISNLNIIILSGIEEQLKI